MLPMLKTLKEFIGGPLGLLAGLVSAVLVAIAAIKLVNHQPRAGWMWLFFGAVALVLLAFWRFHEMRQERDAAKTSVQSVTQKLIDMGENASLGESAVSMTNIRMAAGETNAGAARRRSQRRWFRRILDDAQREDLASRCEVCSVEILEWLHRAEPQSHASDPSERWQENERLRNAHRAETESVLASRFVARGRDLLNECAEAGYSLNPDLEEMRVGGDIQWFNRDAFAQGIGIVGRRVARGSKRL